MRLRIHVQEGLPRSVREYVERRLQFALGRFGPRVHEVVVRLEDVGGVDKRCSMAVRLLRAGRPIFVQDTASDVHVACSGAAERTARAVARELDRRRFDA